MLRKVLVVFTLGLAGGLGALLRAELIQVFLEQTVEAADEWSCALTSDVTK